MRSDMAWRKDVEWMKHLFSYVQVTIQVSIMAFLVLPKYEKSNAGRVLVSGLHWIANGLLDCNPHDLPIADLGMPNK